MSIQGIKVFPQELTRIIQLISLVGVTRAIHKEPIRDKISLPPEIILLLHPLNIRQHLVPVAVGEEALVVGVVLEDLVVAVAEVGEGEVAVPLEDRDKL
jgi:hypothetical protein